MGAIKYMMKNREIKENGKSMLEELVTAIVGGDILALGKLLQDILNSP